MYSVFLRLGRSQKKLFSANGNKSAMVDCDEIYTLKPYFPIFIAKKAGKNKWLRTGKKRLSETPIHLIWKRSTTAPICNDNVDFENCLCRNYNCTRD